jgi:hypothetical protein
MKLHPELARLPKTNETKQRLCEACVGTWEGLAERAFDNNSIKSMVPRLEAVIKANGWYTKY